MSAPPPIPPTTHAPPPSAPAPKQRMSGCAIAAIIGAVLLVPGIALLGILAAIAVPAYQEYVTKTRVVVAYTMAQELQYTVDEQREQSGSCPDNAALGLEDPKTYELGSDSSGLRPQATVQTGAVDSGHCAIEMTFKNINANIDGKTLVLESAENGWTCYDGTLDGKYRPAQCRAPNIFTQTDSAP